MKYSKVKYKMIIVIIVCIIFSISNKIYAIEINDSELQDSEYTQEYKDWLNLPEEERKKTLIPRAIEIKDNGFESKSRIRTRMLSDELIPSSFDLRTKIDMPVRNQETTGECWALATLGSLESNLKLKKLVNLDLSERHMDYATSNSFTTPNENGANREVNTGGYESLSISYLTNGMGAILEEDMPFSTSFGTKDISYIQGKKVVTKVEDIVQFPSFNNTSLVEKENIMKKIKQHIMNNGAVTTSVNGDAGKKDSKYYNKETAASYCDENIAPNHEVLIIGWDDNFSKENFNSGKRPLSNGAWIIQNSWGDTYGKNGYFYISYEDKVLGKQSMGIKNSTNNIDYNNIYQHTGMPISTATKFATYTSSDCSEEKLYEIEVFERKTKQKEQLTQIGVRLDQDTYCKVYVNPKNGNKSKSNLVQATEEYTLCSAGYHTITLDKPISLEQDEFAVAVEYYVPKGTAQILVTSKKNEKTSNIIPVEGQSFLTDKFYTTDKARLDLAKSGQVGSLKAITSKYEREEVYKVEHYKQNPDGTYPERASETEEKNGKVGESVTAIVKTYDGYTQDTENEKRIESGEIKEDGSLVLKVYYKANTNTAYRVEHYLQNLENTEYTIDSEATESKSGVTGAQTIAEEKEYKGFTAQSFEQKEIAGDGSTIIRIYYNRNTDTAYKVEHYKQNPDGTYPERASEIEEKNGKTGERVTATVKTYEGYTEDTENADRIPNGIINGDGSLVLKLYYAIEKEPVNTEKVYKIEHYKQNPDGTYPEKASETEEKSGEVGESVEAIVKTYDGYKEDTENENRIVSGEIKEDGSLVLKVYYKANTDTEYRVEHYLQNLENTEYTINSEATESKSGVTGAQTIAEEKEYKGFTAQSFEQKEIAGDGSTIIRIYYNRNTDTAYKVEHYKQNPDGTYPERASEIEEKNGKTGERVTATVKTYEGYTEDTENTDRIPNGIINGDGNLVLKLYYKINRDNIKNIIGVPSEDEEKNKTIEIVSTSFKEIEKVTINGKILEKNENGKYIYYPSENATYEIVVVYKDGTTEKETYKETRLNSKENNSSNNKIDNSSSNNKMDNNYNNNDTDSNRNKNRNTSTNKNLNGNKNQILGTGKDDTLATKTISRTGRTYIGVIVLLIVTVMNIIVITKKYRDDKDN